MDKSNKNNQANQYKKRKMAENVNLSLGKLEAELRNAYVKKVLECQIREKEASREITKIRENYMANVEKCKNLQVSMADKMRETAMSLRREAYRRELEDAISEKERSRLMADREARRERKVLEDLDRRVEESEIERRTERRRELMEIDKRDKLILAEMRKIRESEERDWEERRTKEAEAYRKEIETREEELRKLARHQQNRRERLSAAVAKILIDLQAVESIERDSEIGDMVAEEIAWEIIVHEREEQMRRAKMRQYLKKGLVRQIKIAQESSLREKQMDRAFTENVMRRVMENERVEKLTKEVRARNATIYRRQLTRLMYERDRIRRNEIQRINEKYERERELEQTREAKILEARKTLLLEHASNVAPYLNQDSLTENERRILAEFSNDRE